MNRFSGFQGENGLYILDQVTGEVTFIGKDNKTILDIEFDKKQDIQIDIVNIQGQYIDQLFNGLTSYGTNSWQYSNTYIPSGIYYFRIKLNNEILSHKFIIYKSAKVRNYFLLSTTVSLEIREAVLS